MLGGRILYGGDYNPDQWLEHPEDMDKLVSETLEDFKAAYTQ